MTDHGAPQLPRVEVDPIGQEMQSIALKSGCFDRSSDKMMKGFPGAAGPRKGADQTGAGVFRLLPRRLVWRTAERKRSGKGRRGSARTGVEPDRGGWQRCRPPFGSGRGNGGPG